MAGRGAKKGDEVRDLIPVQPLLACGSSETNHYRLGPLGSAPDALIDLSP